MPDDPVLEKIKEEGKAVIRIEALEEGGLAVYGREFGRYPVKTYMLRAAADITARLVP